MTPPCRRASSRVRTITIGRRSNFRAMAPATPPLGFRGTRSTCKPVSASVPHTALGGEVRDVTGRPPAMPTAPGEHHRGRWMARQVDRDGPSLTVESDRADIEHRNRLGDHGHGSQARLGEESAARSRERSEPRSAALCRAVSDRPSLHHDKRESQWPPTGRGQIERGEIERDWLHRFHCHASTAVIHVPWRARPTHPRKWSPVGEST